MGDFIEKQIISVKAKLTAEVKQKMTGCDTPQMHSFKSIKKKDMMFTLLDNCKTPTPTKKEKIEN